MTLAMEKRVSKEEAKRVVERFNREYQAEGARANIGWPIDGTEGVYLLFEVPGTEADDWAQQAWLEEISIFMEAI